MKNKIIFIRDIHNGEYGHAWLREATARKPEHYEVRLLNDYDNSSIHSVPTFFIYYEVLENEERD
tara:strand:- start:10504 stop:10698 length:195 start_codon:yes stop_codon:yes gene_type:complete